MEKNQFGLKIGDLVVLTKAGKSYFGIPSSKLSPVFSILSIYGDTKNIHGYELNERNKYKKFIMGNHYRKATDGEVKLYEIKSMF